MATRLLLISYRYPCAFRFGCCGVLLLNVAAVGLALSPLFPTPCNKMLTANADPLGVGVGEREGRAVGETLGLGHQPPTGSATAQAGVASRQAGRGVHVGDADGVDVGNSVGVTVGAAVGVAVGIAPSSFVGS